MSLPFPRLFGGSSGSQREGLVCDTVFNCLTKSLDGLSTQIEGIELGLTKLFYIFCIIGILNVVFIVVFFCILCLALRTWRREQEIVARQQRHQLKLMEPKGMDPKGLASHG